MTRRTPPDAPVNLDEIRAQVVNARKDLKKRGLRAYEVTGPKGTMVIERERPWRFVVRPENWPRDPHGAFFSMKFNRLFKARAHAEAQVGLSP